MDDFLQLLSIVKADLSTKAAVVAEFELKCVCVCVFVLCCNLKLVMHSSLMDENYRFKG